MSAELAPVGGELAQPGRQTRGHMALDPGAAVGVLGGIDPAVAVNPGHQIPTVIGNGHVDPDIGGFDELTHLLPQPIQTLAGMGGDEYRTR